MDNILSDLLSLKLGIDPDTPNAHSEIRALLQEWIDQNEDQHQTRISQWLHGRDLLMIADSKLTEAYW